MKTFQTIQNELRDLIPQGTDKTIEALKNFLVPGTYKHNDLILLESRYEEVNRKLLQGIISQEDATLEYNNIRKDLLDFINELNESDLPSLSDSPTNRGIPDVFNGEVLYRIPKKMQLGIEEECTVRIAFDRKVLLENFEVEVGDVMKDLHISNVMGVEMLDQGHAFQITTVYDTVQKIEKNLVTEWVFCVTPLKEGEFPLILKISIIEIEEGIERKRNVVLKEKVVILTQKPEDIVPDFVSAGYTWQAIDTVTQRAAADGASKGIESPSPSMPNTPPSPPVPNSQPSNATKALGLGLIGKVIAGVATAVIGVVGVSQLMKSSDAPTDSMTEVADDSSAGKLKRLRKNPSRRDLEQFIQENPTAPEAQTAMLLMDSLETATWNSALASYDRSSMENYLREYPEGKYLDDATQRIWDLDNDPVAIQEAPEPIPGEEPEKIKVEDEAGGIGKNTKPQQPVSPKKPKTNTKTPPKKNDPKPKPSNPKTEIKPSKLDKQPTTPEKVKPAPVDPNRPLTPATVASKPVYKGCEKKSSKDRESCTRNKIQSFLENGLTYPPEAFEKKIKGTVNVSFVIERDGSITDVHATNDIGGGCAEAAVKLIKKMPKFKPGLNAKGEKVRVLYNQPVRFQLD